MLDSFYTCMLMKSGSFPRDIPTWDGNTVEDHIWTEWKSFFNLLQAALERESIAATGQLENFGNADSHKGTMELSLTHPDPT